jgi:hypothetical protein
LKCQENSEKTFYCLKMKRCHTCSCREEALFYKWLSFNIEIY